MHYCYGEFSKPCVKANSRIMSPPLPAHRAVRSPALAGPRAWRASAVALAVAFTLGLSAPDVYALSLGRIAVQSALGEPLRAEIDVPQITPEEIANLRTGLGSPEAFRAAGMERSPALADLQISLQQRPNGTYFLRLSSERAVNEPFLDLILEASGPTGRIVREYTLLFDPPSLRQAPTPAAPIPAQIAPPAAPAAASLPEPAAPQASAAPAPAPAASAPAPAASPAAAPAGRKVTVQGGQTAGAIAAANKPATVSLDQMLVSLLRNNPDAFIGGNVNRLKAGAVLEMPTEAQAAAVGQPEARQTLVAQSKDFNAFKQRLAEGVTDRAPTTSPPGRAASGQVQTRVEDKKPAAAAPDKLTLSKGAVDAPAGDGKATEDRIARERAQRDAAARAAEIDRNIADLKRLGSESAALATPAASAASATASGAGIPVASAVPAPAAETASTPAADAASAPASAASSAASAAPSAAESDSSALLENPALLGAAGGLLALLLGWALYRRRRQARAETPEPATHDRLPPDSFFGGSGGQHIDTAEAASSMLYSPSQIDAAGDVDPVAEADVYLAYGRDLQAEEILREALRTTPQRVAIHAKLLEILARRNDPRAFEPLAREAQALTGGIGPVWEQIAGLGQEIDPGNPLYVPGRPGVELSRAELDAAPKPAPAPTPALAPAVPAGLDLDFASFPPPPVATRTEEAAGSPFDFGDEPAPTPAAAKADANTLDFDLAGLSLELDEPARDTPANTAGHEALTTKLSLAEEFQAIGDADGARSLLQEVLAEADGELRRRAERMLAELG